MILIDSKNLLSSALQDQKKVSSQKNNGKKFIQSDKAKETKNFDSAKEVVDIAPMLFLQEMVGTLGEDKQNLEEFGQKALKSLKELQISLLNNELDQKHLYDLREVLENHTWQFSDQELKNIANEIAIRVEVEIAKLEVRAEVV